MTYVPSDPLDTAHFSDRPSAEAARAMGVAVHGLTIVGMAVVSSAAAVYLIKDHAVAPPMGAASALAIFVVALAVHGLMVRRSAALSARTEPAAPAAFASPAKRLRRRRTETDGQTAPSAAGGPQLTQDGSLRLSDGSSLRIAEPVGAERTSGQARLSGSHSPRLSAPLSPRLSEPLPPRLSEPTSQRLSEPLPPRLSEPTSQRLSEPTELALNLLARASLSAQSGQQSTLPPPLPGDQSPHWQGAGPAKLNKPAPESEARWPASADQFAAAPSESEVQRVERLVRRLADHVNNLTPPPLADATKTAAGPAAAATTASEQLAASISSLKAGLGAPTADPTSPATAVESPQPWRETTSHDRVDPIAEAQRAAVLAALDAQRIDVTLEPILGLADQRPHHYEIQIALRNAGGQHIQLDDIENGLGGTGVLAQIDRARVSHAGRVARRLADRGKTGAVFAALHGETLADDEAGSAMGREAVGAFPAQIVLTLPQAHVRVFAAADWDTVTRLRAAGFAFALSDLTSLDMDFAWLSARGFAFARLDAETFLIGLPTSGGIVPPADICQHLAACGLALIVGGIVEDDQLARIFGFGVAFGQGQLFGGPRPVAGHEQRPLSAGGASVAAE